MPDDNPLSIPDMLRIQLANGRVETMLLDEYLKGVVPTEMGLQKPLEALKAQAIAARSYAVTTRRHALDGFDLCTTTHCQVWKPQNRYPDSDQAVDETAGWVITYNGQVVAAHFFGHCDGHTRNSEEVWSGKVAYYRSVPCICGYTKLYGHGVGMCQRGAAAMAVQGSKAEEILTHYYTGIQVARATVIPRQSLQDSLIFGQVVDGSGQPKGGERLKLEGPGGPLSKGTTSDGRFWFSDLPAGRWVLAVKGRPVQYGDLFTDGRSSVQVQVTVPDELPLSIRTTSMAGLLQLVGTVGYENVPITLVDPAGDELTVISGSAPAYNPGGFMIPLPAAGTYTLHVLGQSFDVEIGSTGIWVQIDVKPV
jgi:Stage II sporulation protein